MKRAADGKVEFGSSNDAMLTAFSVVFLMDVAELSAGGSAQFADAGVVLTVRTADSRRADRVTKVIATRRTHTERLTTIRRRRTTSAVVTRPQDNDSLRRQNETQSAVVTADPDTRISPVSGKNVARSRDVEQRYSDDDDDTNNDDVYRCRQTCTTSAAEIPANISSTLIIKYE